MSVIVRGMEMPDRCDVCPCCQMVMTRVMFMYFCGAMEKQMDIRQIDGRHKDCPLFEVKDWREI